jgi:elongation factor Ts
MTGAGMMECKAALTEAKGNMDEATAILRKRGLAQATRKAGRSTNEGLIGSYIHMGGKVGVLLEVSASSGDTAAKDAFRDLVKDITLHIAAAAPKGLSRDDIAAELVEAEKDIFRVQLANEGKPAEMIEKILLGKLGKFFAESCLLEQGFVKNPDLKVEAHLGAVSKQLGDTLSIRRFLRFQIGE